MEIKWQKGKTTSIARGVDKLAKAAARVATRTDWGFQPGKIARSTMGPHGASTLFPANNQQATVRVYRKSLTTNKAEYKIFFELFSVEKKQYVAKHYAYAPSDIGHEMHRSHCYKCEFNGNPKYPRVEGMEPLKDCPSELKAADSTK